MQCLVVLKIMVNGGGRGLDHPWPQLGYIVDRRVGFLYLGIASCALMSFHDDIDWIKRRMELGIGYLIDYWHWEVGCMTPVYGYTLVNVVEYEELK